MKTKTETNYVPLALELFTQILDGCKELALVEVLDELEGLKLGDIMRRLMALHDRCTDRLLMESFDERGTPAEQQELAELRIRTQERLLADLHRGVPDPFEQALILDLLDENLLGEA